MSLKRLIDQARKSTIREGAKPTTQESTFASLEYDLNLRTPDKKALVTHFKALLKDFEAEPDHLTDETKNKLILASYRLALSQDSRAVGCFHPSEISQEENPCERKMYFQKGAVPKDKTYVNFTSDNRMMRLVDLGTLLHLYVQENLDRLGVLKGFEVPVVSEEFGVKGKMDGVVEFVGLDSYGQYYEQEDMALEIKSISEFGFKGLRRPKPEHVKQASIYGYFLGYKRICFLYYNKNNSDLKTYVEEVDVDYVEGFKKLASRVIKQYNNQIRKHRTTVVSEHTEIPHRICSHRNVERAMNCAYADYCFAHRSQP